MEPASAGQLQIHDRAGCQDAQKPGMDPDRTQNLARQEDVGRESGPLMTTQHQPANHRRDDEVDERIPGVMAAEVEPMSVERQRSSVGGDHVSTTGAKANPRAPGGRLRIVTRLPTFGLPWNSRTSVFQSG